MLVKLTCTYSSACADTATLSEAVSKADEKLHLTSNIACQLQSFLLYSCTPLACFISISYSRQTACSCSVLAQMCKSKIGTVPTYACHCMCQAIDVIHIPARTSTVSSTQYRTSSVSVMSSYTGCAKHNLTPETLSCNVWLLHRVLLASPLLTITKLHNLLQL